MARAHGFSALRGLVAAGCTLAPCVPIAAETLPVDIHGFVSQGYLKSDENNYLGQSQRGSFDFNEAGVNVSKNLSPQLRVGMQLFARDLGTLGGDQITLDWAYGDYRISDSLGVRVGRIREPGGFYNETRDIDLARTSILLPQSVYPENYRDVLSSYNGGCVYGDVRLAGLGSLDYQLFGGGEKIGSNSSVAQAVTDAGALSVSSVDVKYVMGAGLVWTTPLRGLRLGATVTKLAIDYSGQTTAIPFFAPSQPFHITLDQLEQFIVSAEYTVGDLIVSAEGERIHVRGTTDIPGQPEIRFDSGGWYLNADYRLTHKLGIGCYYSEYYSVAPNGDSHDPSMYQRDLALTCAYDITDNWLVKVEGHWIRGYAALLQQENLGPGFPFGSKQAETDWVLFAAKTTVSF